MGKKTHQKLAQRTQKESHTSESQSQLQPLESQSQLQTSEFHSQLPQIDVSPMDEDSWEVLLDESSSAWKALDADSKLQSVEEAAPAAPDPSVQPPVEAP